MKRNLAIAMAIGLLMLAGCDTASPDPGDTQNDEVEAGTNGASSTNPVTTPDGDEVGESVLQRETERITLNFEACCVTPGNAYTAWWVIGDVELSMTATAINSELATGFVADSVELDLELILNAGSDGIDDPYDGVRLAVLDHGPDTGDPRQLTSPSGGCTSMCPVVFTTTHSAP